MTWIFELIKDLLIAWRDGNRKIRIAICASGVFVILGAIVVFLSNILLWHNGLQKVGETIGTAIIVVGAVIAVTIYVIQRSKEEFRKEQKIEAVEKRVQDNPRETQATWELARVKLESYLDRNLSQVKSIFWLTLLVMTGGFVLIGVGVYEAFLNANNFQASVLTTCSGVIVSFMEVPSWFYIRQP